MEKGDLKATQITSVPERSNKDKVIGWASKRGHLAQERTTPMDERRKGSISNRGQGTGKLIDPKCKQEKLGEMRRIVQP